MISFFNLVRWPNILIICLSMCFMLFCVINPVLGLDYFKAGLSLTQFLLLVVATILITIAGYTLNDIFDINTDSVNKPRKNIIGKKLRVHVAQILYWILNISGILIGSYVAYAIGKINYSLVFVFAAGLLWFYSERYQCQPIVGNIVVAFLSALTIALVWLFTFFALIKDPAAFTGVQQQFSTLNMLVLIFSGFAFLTSFIRELVKDMEDIKGDDRFGCRTFPVVFGIKKAKYIVLFSVIVALIFSIWSQVYFASAAYMKLFYYFFAIDLFLLIVGYRIIGANCSKDFNKISIIIKLLMITGILSMGVVYYEF